jgi:malonyl-ACP O-methyltransferase BioC
LIGASAIINRFARAVSTYETQATAQRTAAEALVNLLGRHLHTLAPRVLEIGCGTGLLTRQMIARFAPSEMVLNDICPEMEICFTNVPRTTFLPGDAQTLAWPGQFDVIVSSSAVQWFDDLRAFAKRCAAVMPKGGILAVSGFGPQTLKEVRELTGYGLNYPDFNAFTEAFSEDFTLLESEPLVCAMQFESGWEVLRHLKETGVTATGAGREQLWTRRQLAKFVADYQRRFSNERGEVTLTYEPFLFVGSRK